MHHSHGHDHSHELGGNQLRSAFALTVLILIIEVVAGYRANSLALLSDAGHILTDVFALGLAWFAVGYSRRPADDRNTFGYARISILAALANSTTLLVIGAVVAFEAVGRVGHPENVAGPLTAAAALGALLINVYIARSLHGHEQENVNVRAAFVHVVSDIGASAAVIVSGLVIALWHARIIDPLLSLGIAALIVFSAWQLLRDTVFILMESTPRDVDIGSIESAMLEVPGVEGVHDLHVWALSDGFRLLSAHVRIPDQELSDAANLLSDLRLLLRRRFHISHATLEAECMDCSEPQRRPIRLYALRTGDIAGDRTLEN